MTNIITTALTTTTFTDNTGTTIIEVDYFKSAGYYASN